MRYLLDYKGWTKAVNEAAGRASGTSGPVNEAVTLQDIQNLLPKEDLGKSGADGKLGPLTIAAIHKALTAAKAAPAPEKKAETPAGTQGTSGTAGTAGAVAPTPEKKAETPAGTQGTAGTAGTTVKAPEKPAAQAPAKPAAQAPAKPAPTSQQKLDQAKAEVKGLRKDARQERKTDRIEGKIDKLKAKVLPPAK
jgi:hypothetical protein